MNRLPPLIARPAPAVVPEVPGTARVQCVACRWDGVASQMRQTFVYRPGESRVCPQCDAPKMHFLADGEQPLPLHPMNATTRVWLKMAGFVDCGVEKGKRLFRHHDTTPRLMLRLEHVATIPEVLSLIRRMGAEEQAERTRQAWRDIVATVRRGQALPEAGELGEMLVPDAGSVVDGLEEDPNRPDGEDLAWLAENRREGQRS